MISTLQTHFEVLIRCKQHRQRGIHEAQLTVIPLLNPHMTVRPGGTTVFCPPVFLVEYPAGLAGELNDIINQSINQSRMSFFPAIDLVPILVNLGFKNVALKNYV